MDNKDLLTLYMKYSSNAFLLEMKLKRSIIDFFNKYCEEHCHCIEVYAIKDHGKYIVLKDYSNDGSHIPLDLIQDFCLSFNVTCEEISRTVSIVDPLADNVLEKGNIYTILFEDVRREEELLIGEVREYP